MPYDSITELPYNLREILPNHAQEIYIAAYNNAYMEYKDHLDRKDPNETREEVAHKVAWAAVKKKYHKEGYHWIGN